MNKSLNRDYKLAWKWKNFPKPGSRKGSLTEEERHLVIYFQAKHSNRRKKIASEVSCRTAKRLGKWWEAFKEKQQRKHKETRLSIQLKRANTIAFNTFAEKLIKERTVPQTLMSTSNGGFLQTDPPAPSPPTLLPPWLVSSGTSSTFRPPSPSVTLSLSPSTVPPAPAIPWLQTDRVPDNTSYSLSSYPSLGIAPLVGENPLVSQLMECCRELEEERRTWAAHKKEAAWRLKRIELQLESEKACRRKEKMEEIEAKVKALREEQKITLDRIEAEYREQLVGLRREAEAKEQKLAEQWAAKHMRLTKFLEQTGYRSISSEPNGR